MTTKNRRLQLTSFGKARGGILAVTGALALAACGGGGPTADPAAPAAAAAAPETPSAAATTLKGVAASGAPMQGARIVVKDSNASTPDALATAEADGSYTVDVTGLVAPLVVTATGTVLGETVTYASLVPSVTARVQTTANVTPLTHAVAALVSADGDPASLGDAASIGASVNAAAVGNAVSALVTSLSADPGTRELLAAGAGGNASTFNPMSSVFAASGSDSHDKVLEQIKVSVSAAGVSLTNVAAGSDESAGVQSTPSVTLTTANLAAPLSAPSLPVSTVTDLPGARDLKAMADAFTACFALPTAQRRTANTDGSIASLHPSCAELVTADYLSNGYNWKQDFEWVFNDDGMTGAVFSPAAIALAGPGPRHTDPKVLKNPYCNTATCAVVMLGARQANGAPRGWYFLMAQAPSSGASTAWRAIGNQRKYDLYVDTRVARLMAVNSAGAATSAFYGKSMVESRMRVGFNPLGPNGTDVRLIRAAPASEPIGQGIVLARSSQCSTASRFSIHNRNGAIVSGSPSPTPIHYTNGGSNDLRFDAVHVDPVTGAALPGAVAWPNTTASPDANQTYTTAVWDAADPLLPAWAVWRVEIFKFGSATPLVADEIQYLRVANAMMRAETASRLGWATVLPGFLDAYLRPDGAGASPATPLTEASVTWTQPAGAGLHESAYMFSQAQVNVGGVNYNRRSLMSANAAPIGTSGATMKTGEVPWTRIGSGTGTATQTSSISAANNGACPTSPASTDHSLTGLTTNASAYRELGISTRAWSGAIQQSAYFWRSASN
jgi:hypothetical protein